MACGGTKQLRVPQLPNLFLHFGKHRHCPPCFSAFLLKPCSWGEFSLAFHELGIIFQARALGCSLSPCVIPMLVLEFRTSCKIPSSWVLWVWVLAVRSWALHVCLRSCLSKHPVLALPWNGNFTGLIEPNVSHRHTAAPSTGRNSWTSQIIGNGT